MHYEGDHATMLSHDEVQACSKLHSVNNLISCQQFCNKPFSDQMYMLRLYTSPEWTVDVEISVQSPFHPTQTSVLFPYTNN